MTQLFQNHAISNYFLFPLGLWNNKVQLQFEKINQVKSLKNKNQIQWLSRTLRVGPVTKKHENMDCSVQIYLHMQKLALLPENKKNCSIRLDLPSLNNVEFSITDGKAAPTHHSVSGCHTSSQDKQLKH